MPGTWASGVFSFMDVVVKNYGTKPVRDVAVPLEADGRAQPAVTIPQIPPQGLGGSGSRSGSATAGEHRVVARLEPDAVTVDNSRFAVLEVAAELPVLLVDGDPAGRDAPYRAPRSPPARRSPRGSIQGFKPPAI